MATYEITAPDGSVYEVTAPDSASESEVLAYAKANAPGWQDQGTYRASQADVRKAESPAVAENADRQISDVQAQFDRDHAAWLAKTGGALKPGQNIRKAVVEFSGRADPNDVVPGLQMERIRQTKEFPEGQAYGESLAYKAAKPAAEIVGFATGGPAGATGAGAMVRIAALTNGLSKAVEAGALTQEEAADRMQTELMRGVSTDAAFNFGVPMLAKAVANIPGARWLGAKVTDRLARLAGGAIKQATAGLPEGVVAPEGLGSADDLVESMFAPAPRQRVLTPELQKSLVTAERANLAQTPEQATAVRELAKRSENLPTPGQVTGVPSTSEQAARIAHRGVFEAQEKSMQGAAEQMRQEQLYPQGQPSAQALGQQILDTAQSTQAAVKARLAPVWKEARAADVSVDLTQVVNEAEDAVERFTKVPGGNELKSGEVAKLRKIIGDLRVEETAPTPGAVLGPSGEPLTMTPGSPAAVKLVGPGEALDFMSARKNDMRALTIEGEASPLYKKILGDLISGADDAYKRAIVGHGDLSARLVGARNTYREMMETVYDDAVQQALRKNPEDIGRLFWQRGNVSEPQQLQTLLTIAKREGTMSEKEAAKLSGDMLRGFLQEAVPSTEAAAKWSQTLKADPTRSRTFAELSKVSGAGDIADGMKVLEAAAQMSHRTLTPDINIFGNPVQRLARGGLISGAAIGYINMPLLGAGLSMDATLRAMATAYTSGNKGIVRDLIRVLRLGPTANPAGVPLVRESLARLQAWGSEQGIDLVTEAENLKDKYGPR